jgi:hypothetical protein
MFAIKIHRLCLQYKYTNMGMVLSYKISAINKFLPRRKFGLFFYTQLLKLSDWIVKELRKIEILYHAKSEVFETQIVKMMQANVQHSLKNMYKQVRRMSDF